MQTIQNVKIPYATEGIIRTAQLDDTITPENSVQLAVNMNFDRIGAIQTRLGVTEFATQRDAAIRNFGTLNNSITLPGFANMIKLGDTDTFEGSTSTNFIAATRIDDTHALVVWEGVDGDGFMQVARMSQDEGGFVMLGSALEFDTSTDGYNSVIKVDSTHFLNAWQGPSGDGFAQIFEVNLTTYAVTALGSPFEFDTADASQISLTLIDGSHALVCYTGTSNAGKAAMLAINTGTWAVTRPASPTTYEATNASYNSCAALGDGSHFAVAWRDSNGDGMVQSMSINTGTGVITLLSSAFEFDTDAADYIVLLPLGDGEHFVCFWSGTSQVGLVQVFNTNLTTYAITAVGTATTFESTNAIYISAASAGDGEHFVGFWLKEGSEDTGMGQIFEVDQTTFEVTAVRLPVSLGLQYIGANNTALYMSSGYAMNFWKNPSQNGVGAVFRLDGDITFQNFLYAQVDDEIQNWDNPGWVVRRSGIDTTEKARFAQFLNYIWMVNGNASFGDPVMTSNGGAFGTDLVPAGFPPGDFISAGFEGRVWVIDKLYGIIYYTDIVQFTPPDQYSLTYDPDVNFIKDLSPQDGQTFTGMVRVPRALLVFRQDTIFRIYGATSIDAYPAYNVGTYSNESIVQTKTGIFFHHSSGIYQFDYGGQPVEISRRIIDFIRAIPRANYENITGVYDGFDAVEWAVGTVTVEGVTFTSCMLRYSISTQVWTVYDYVGNAITAMITYDNGTDLNHLMGTEAGKVGALDVGISDFGQPFYFEFIDRWRSFTEMYAKVKSISGFNVYSENAAGSNLVYQTQGSGPNAWESIGPVDENNNALLPNEDTGDFDVIRLRLVGTSRGTPVVVHGIEILSITDKGFNEN